MNMRLSCPTSLHRAGLAAFALLLALSLAIGVSAQTADDGAAKDTADDAPGSPDTGVEPDLAYGAFQRGYYLTAFELALPRARLGDPAAQTLIAELYDKGLGIARNPQEAAAWYEIAAASGNREAQFAYAIMLLEGKHVTADRDLARQMLRQSADAGHPVAQFNFAQLLVEERPTSKGIEIARGYYESAAKAGVADAYFALAQIYGSELNVLSQDLPKARDFLVRAARAGIENAQIELGIWLANGRGGEVDMAGARAWFRRAAMGGNVIAQNRLARMLLLGLGGEVDRLEAAKWYVLARRRGHKDAMLDDFFRSLDDETRSQALEAADRWPLG